MEIFPGLHEKMFVGLEKGLNFTVARTPGSELMQTDCRKRSSMPSWTSYALVSYV